MALAGLIGCILLVALAYRGATWIAEAMVESERPLAPEFLQSLVPIALVYAVAHYFTRSSSPGQYISRSRRTRSGSAGISSGR